MSNFLKIELMFIGLGDSRPTVVAASGDTSVELWIDGPNPTNDDLKDAAYSAVADLLQKLKPNN